jgi:hypothetical protein
MFGLQDPQPNEVGELNTTKIKGHHGHKHFPFNKNAIDIFNKHHKSYNRLYGRGNPPEFSRLNQRYNTSTTAELMKTSLFNPTRGSEKLSFHEHETNMHLHYPKSRPRYESVSNHNTEIIDKIEAWKKPGNHYYRRPEHSQTLRIRRL